MNIYNSKNKFPILIVMEGMEIIYDISASRNFWKTNLLETWQYGDRPGSNLEILSDWLYVPRQWTEY